MEGTERGRSGCGSEEGGIAEKAREIILIFRVQRYQNNFPGCPVHLSG